jgi:intracellular septation protein A
MSDAAVGEGEAPARRGLTMWVYRRRFEVDRIPFEVKIWSRFTGMDTKLFMRGQEVAEDRTPLMGPDAVRNHQLSATLPDGRRLDVEAGWISSFNTGIAVRVDGRLVHESHPGRSITFPEKYRQAIVEGFKEGKDGARGMPDGFDFSVWKRNRVPLAVDIAMGLIFFVMAKLTDLPTAALVAAGLGIGLIVAQRFVTVDLIGGLALFGVVMALLSAGLAIAFQDDMAVKLRGVILGCTSATCFFGDGLLFKGKRLGKGLMRYLPYSDLDPRRLAMGMGVLGLVMALINWAVAAWTSTNFWLFYTTFGDFILIIFLVQVVLAYARGRLGKRQRGEQAHG